MTYTSPTAPANPLAAWLSDRLKSGDTDRQIADALHSHEMLFEVGYIPQLQDLLTAFRILQTPAPTPTGRSKVPTVITLCDEAGVVIEETRHESPAEAAAAVTSFLEVSSDANWAAQSLATPGPSDYSIRVHFDHSGASHHKEDAACPGNEAPGATLWETVIIPMEDDARSSSPAAPAPTWPTRVERGSDGGLLILARRPDQTEACFHIEVQNGHLQAKIWPDVEGDQDAAITVQIREEHIAVV